MDQQIMKKHLAAALGYSYTRMALNYYMYFEGRADEKDSSQWEMSFAPAFQKRGICPDWKISGRRL